MPLDPSTAPLLLLALWLGVNVIALASGKPGEAGE